MTDRPTPSALCERHMVMLMLQHLHVAGQKLPVADADTGLCGFIPVFDTRAQAEVFAEGRHEVQAITTAGTTAYDAAAGDRPSQPGEGKETT